MVLMLVLILSSELAVISPAAVTDPLLSIEKIIVFVNLI
jgi:hypothetical protein